MSDQHRSAASESEGAGQQVKRVLASHLLPVTRPVCAFAEDIRSVRRKGTIYIFCGEAHPTVYNAPELHEAFREAKHVHEARVVVITGPILLAPDGGDGLNGLISLYDQDLITDLYHRPIRHAANHFRVIETNSTHKVYSECAHPPLLEERFRACENYQGLTDAQVDALALKSIRTFKFWKKHSLPHDEAVKRGLPLTITADNLAKLMISARTHHFDVEDLDADGLRALQPHGEEEWLVPLSMLGGRRKVHRAVHS